MFFAGGLLLLWVAWKMWRELRAHDAHATESDIAPRAKTFAGAAWAVALADVSMSLDNVLGVAGAARDHPTILVFGLVFSVAVMGLAASLIARVVDRSEEHTSELPSLMRISYAVFCLKKKP